jgi:CTP:molybdopterin cytidylyltransferase MocA
MNYALIPASGKSTRMGRPKLALPLGGRTLLEHGIHALRTAGVHEILVVVGPHVPELVLLAQSAGAQTLLLDQPTPHMRTTIEHGLRWLEERFHPQGDDDWLLLPGDFPLLEEGVVRQLLEARQRFPLWSIVVPSFAGKRGHPLLLSWSHVAGIQSLPEGLGLNAYLRLQFGQILELPVSTAEILRDIDTPEDYERLQQAWQQRQRNSAPAP